MKRGRRGSSERTGKTLEAMTMAEQPVELQALVERLNRAEKQLRGSAHGTTISKKFHACFCASGPRPPQRATITKTAIVPKHKMPKTASAQAGFPALPSSLPGN
jgi:hypothetical protein